MDTLPFFVVHIQALRRCLGPHEQKIKGYPQTPTTLGQHLRKRRLDLGMTQEQAAERFKISVTAYNGWEADRIAPAISKWPKIIEFLGFDPTPEPANFPEAVRAVRRAGGFEQRALAARLGVDTKSVVNWENGRNIPFETVRKRLGALAPGQSLFVARGRAKAHSLRVS